MRQLRLLVVILIVLRAVPSVAQERSPDAVRPLASSNVLDDYWDDRFDLPGSGVGVDRIVVGSEGVLYIQGVSRARGGIGPAPFYRWDGSSLRSLLDSDGLVRVDGMVLEPQPTIVTVGDTVYMAMERGYASVPPHVPSEYYIVRWDGLSWRLIGSPFNAPVYGLAASGGRLYAVGGFDRIGSDTVRGVARWAGGRWSRLGAGINSIVGDISDVAVDGKGVVHICGSFTALGASDVKYLARWDGVGWRQVTPVPSGRIDRLCIGGSTLYARLGDKEVWRWNGASAIRLDTLVPGARVFNPSMAVDSAGRLYTAIYRIEPQADFAMISIARYGGNRWEILPGRIPWGSLSTIAIARGGEVVVGGRFARIDSLIASNIARWDGAGWSPLKIEGRRYDGLGMIVTGAARNGTDLYVCGYEATNAGDRIGRVMRWDGERWTSVSNGLIGVVSVLATGPDGRLYAGGEFSDPNEPSIRNMAWLDGERWRGVGGGVDRPVSALAADEQGVVVGGSGVGGNGYVRTWDGTDWETIAEHVHGKVLALRRWHGDLYVGGSFDSVDGLSARAIARWDGAKWVTLGAGIRIGGRRPSSPNDRLSVLALDVAGESLIVGGQFDTAGAVPAANIAVWGGESWSTLGDGVSGYTGGPLMTTVMMRTSEVEAIAVRGGNIYIGGFFAAAGDIYASRIAMWDTGARSWNRLGSGVADGDVLAMLADGEGI